MTILVPAANLREVDQDVRTLGDPELHVGHV